MAEGSLAAQPCELIVVEVVCPDECAEGDVISVNRPGDHARFEAVVPPGVESGAIFEVELPAAELPRTSDINECVPRGAEVLSADDSEAVIEQAVQRQQLTQEQAAALKAIQLSLHNYDELGWFIERNCRAFRDYDRDAEQRLEWGTLHQEYTQLVEVKIEQQLSYIDADSDDLYALLEEVVGEDSRADSFLNKLLSMGDYATFCDMMRWLGRIGRRTHSTRL